MVAHIAKAFELSLRQGKLFARRLQRCCRFAFRLAQCLKLLALSRNGVSSCFARCCPAVNLITHRHELFLVFALDGDAEGWPGDNKPIVVQFSLGTR